MTVTAKVCVVNVFGIIGGVVSCPPVISQGRLNGPTIEVSSIFYGFQKPKNEGTSGQA